MKNSTGSIKNWIGCKANTPRHAGCCGSQAAACDSCTRWKWGVHGWSVSDGQSCGIMNGNEKERRTALLSVLKERSIDAVEFVSDVDVLEVLPAAPSRA